MIININSIKQKTSKIWLFFLDLIFPIECLGCGREGFWLCGDCFKEVKLKPRQYCLHCKKENDFGQFCPPPARPNGFGRLGGGRGIYRPGGAFFAALYYELLI